MGSATDQDQQTAERVRLDRRHWLSLTVLTVSTFVVLLDASVVNVALPVIVGDLGGSLDAATWVPVGFVLADPRFAKDPALAPAHWHGRDPTLEPPASHVRSVTTADGAEHRRLRSVFAPVFSRRRLLAGEDRFAAIARDLLTDLAEESARIGRPADLVAQFTTQYPLIVVCDLLGVPVADLDRATRVSQAMTCGDPGRAYTGFAELEAMVADALHAEPECDARTTVADILAKRANAEFGDVPAYELRYMITGLIFAGQVTTESFLGFLLAHQLAGHLDVADTMGAVGAVDTAGTVDAFVAEALRLHPPAPFTLWRFTTTALDLAGTNLPAGAPVLIDIEGINTDPSRRRAPYTLDPYRPRLPDLTFGDGPHACVGQADRESPLPGPLCRHETHGGPAANRRTGLDGHPGAATDQRPADTPPRTLAGKVRSCGSRSTSQVKQRLPTCIHYSRLSDVAALCFRVAMKASRQPVEQNQ